MTESSFSTWTIPITFTSEENLLLIIALFKDYCVNQQGSKKKYGFVRSSKTTGTLFITQAQNLDENSFIALGQTIKDLAN